MIDIEDIVEPEWADWYRKTPEERLAATSEAWANYISLGGSLAPDVDTQCPFWSREELIGFAKESKDTRERKFKAVSND